MTEHADGDVGQVGKGLERHAPLPSQTPQRATKSFDAGALEDRSLVDLNCLLSESSFRSRHRGSSRTIRWFNMRLPRG
jgi:hypothetical protein